MAAISEETCGDRRSACRRELYAAIGKRVTWVVLMALLSLLGCGVGYTVVMASTRASAADLQRVEAAADRAAVVAQEGRVSLAALQEAMSSIRLEQSRAAERDQEQARRLDAILRALEDHK